MCELPVLVLAPRVHLRKVDVRLPGKASSNSHGARPVHLFITAIKWIRTSRSGEVVGVPEPELPVLVLAPRVHLPRPPGIQKWLREERTE